MWVYLENTDNRKFEVGFFKPNGEWVVESEFDNRDAAANRVNWLNGGK